MFTNQDCLNYFRQIRDVENRMEDIYRATAHDLVRPDIKAVFEQLMREEKQHDTLVASLEAYFLPPKS